MQSVVMLALLGAAAYRWRGSGDNFVETWVKRFACGAVLGLVTGSLWVFALASVAVIVAHGRFLSMGRPQYRPQREDNWPAWLPRNLGIRRDAKLFDALAMAQTGILWTLPAAVFFALQNNYSAAVVLAVAGLLKPLAYEIGWRIEKTDGVGYGETIFGAFVGAACGVIAYV